MKWIKKILVLVSLIAFFAIGSKSTFVPIEKSKSKEQQLQSSETIQSVGIIQSITETQIQVVVKENKTTFLNYIHHLFEVPTFFIHKTFSLFIAQQDVNRCENVSKLLFPFHFFW